MNVKFIEICWLFKESRIVVRADDNDDDGVPMWFLGSFAKLFKWKFDVKSGAKKKEFFFRSLCASNLSHLNEALLIIWPEEMKKKTQPNWIEIISEMERDSERELNKNKNCWISEYPFKLLYWCCRESPKIEMVFRWSKSAIELKWLLICCIWIDILFSSIQFTR